MIAGVRIAGGKCNLREENKESFALVAEFGKHRWMCCRDFVRSSVLQRAVAPLLGGLQDPFNAILVGAEDLVHFSQVWISLCDCFTFARLLLLSKGFLRL
jgi:hypothetical protein